MRLRLRLVQMANPMSVSGMTNSRDPMSETGRLELVLSDRKRDTLEMDHRQLPH